MRHARAVCAATLFIVLSTGAKAAEVDYFIKIPGVDGEARDGAHDKWIIIESLDWGAYRLDREAGAVRFGDGAHGRRLPSGSSNSSSKGDPDRPVIIGDVPNSSAPAQRNQSDLNFVLSRASRANPKLMQNCANGKHLPKVEIDQLANGQRIAHYVLHDPRFVSFAAGDVRLSASTGTNAVRRQSLNNLQQMTITARTLKTNPTVRLVYQCADWINYKTGAKGGNCAASKTRKDIILKGSKIKEN